MKRLAILSTLALVIGLVGCPSEQRVQVAQASKTASSIIVTFQQSEITAHNQGIVSEEDHQFIEKQLLTISTLGKTLDSCIASVTSPQGDVACLQVAAAGAGQINEDGGLYIKNPQTKQTFQIAMSSFQASLIAVSQIIGGKK